MSFVQQLKGFDLHPKFRDEFRERTRSGGLVSLISLVLIAYLLVSQLWVFFNPGTVETMSVDDTRGVLLRVNFDVSFPAMPCSLVSLDVMDTSGQHQLDLTHNVFKRRLDKHGNAIEESHRNKLGQTLTSKDQLLGNGTHREDVEEKAKLLNSIGNNQGAGSGDSGSGSGSDKPSDGSDATPQCGSCYSAGAEGQCCNTCAEVRSLYRLKGWSFDPASIAQCAKDSVIAINAGTSEEGCNLYGFVEVPRVAGNIHFAPGRSFQHANAHVHDIMSFAVQRFNVSHTIKSFSVGVPHDNQPANPLDGYSKTLRPEDGNGMYQYYLKIVPTDYVSSSGSTTSTNQYSVTEHFRHVSVARGSGLPGVFFFYDVSPIRVTVKPKAVPFLHFVTQLCAIIGGVFTVMGVIDSGVHKAVLRWKNARSLA